jgi:hypothetical protein
VLGPQTEKPITLSRSYVPKRDDPVITFLRTNPEAVLTINSTPLDRNRNVNGETKTYSNCMVTDLTEPALDTASGDPARFEIVVSPQSVTTGASS